MEIDSKIGTVLYELFADSVTLTVAGALGGMAFHFMQAPGNWYSFGGIVATILFGMLLVGMLRFLRMGERPI